MKTVFFLFLFFPLALQAQIYHCGDPDGPVYSQIPCEENAEQIAILDSPMVIDDGDIGAAEPRQESDTVEETPADRLNAFIATLVKQREAHLEQLDRNIVIIRQQMASDSFTNNDEATQEEFRKSLFDMEFERDSILDQYEALIDEAENRAAQ